VEVVLAADVDTVVFAGARGAANRMATGDAPSR
jgi:hypothetical protein